MTDELWGFEALFQVWLAEGGPGKPALSEDLERRSRQLKAAAQTKTLKAGPNPEMQCPHGASPLTCAKCYFGDTDE